MQTTTTTPAQIIKEGKYNFQIILRQGMTRFPNHPYSVLTTVDTPKGAMDYKIASHYVYKSIEEAMAAIDRKINDLKKVAEIKAERKAKQKEMNASANAADFYKVGDILVNTWGWEQTNVNFYKVVEVGKKTIKVQEITHKVEPGSEGSHGMSCNVLPGENFLSNGDGYTLRVKSEGRVSQPERYYYIRKWDGRAMYNLWYA